LASLRSLLDRDSFGNLLEAAARSFPLPAPAQGTEPQAAEHMAEGEPLRERREVMAELKFSVDGMT